MLKHFIETFYPEDAENEDYFTEADMGNFRVQFAHGTKIYIDNTTGQKLAVWRLEEVKKKLRMGRMKDPYLQNALSEIADLTEGYHNNGSDMEIKRWDECVTVWRKAFDQVMEEPEPEPLKHCEWCGEVEHPGDTCQQPPEEKKSLFRRKKAS